MHQAGPDKIIAVRSEARAGRRYFMIPLWERTPVDRDILPVREFIDDIPVCAIRRGIHVLYGAGFIEGINRINPDQCWPEELFRACSRSARNAGGVN